MACCSACSAVKRLLLLNARQPSKRCSHDFQSGTDECSDIRCETMSASQDPPQLACAPAVELGLGLWLVSACANAPLALIVADLSAVSHSLAFLFNLHLGYCAFAGVVKGLCPATCASFVSVIGATMRTPVAPTAQMSAAWANLRCSAPCPSSNLRS